MLEGLGNIGDFIGGIGVVVTLVYLALQIRHNTRGLYQNSSLMRLSFENELRKNLIHFRLAIAGDPALAELWRRGLDGLDELDPAEAERFELLIGNVFAMLSSQFDAHQRDVYPLTHTPWLRMVAARPGFRTVWDRFRERMEAENPNARVENREAWNWIESLTESDRSR